MQGDSMLDVYLYENAQLLEHLESLLLACESEGAFSPEAIAEIFRILHTIKGSSAMMSFEGIANLAHALEDVFAHMREHVIRKDDFPSISTLSFETLDAIRSEITKIQAGALPDADMSSIIQRIRDFLGQITQRKEPVEAAEQPTQNEAGLPGVTPRKPDGAYGYGAKVKFLPESQMESVRALGMVKSVEDLCSAIQSVPQDLFAASSDEEIVQNGFILYMRSDEEADTLKAKLKEAFFIENLEVTQLTAAQIAEIFDQRPKAAQSVSTTGTGMDNTLSAKQNFMSVNLSKLDALMDIVGEIVITESTVTKNPDVAGLHLENFERASQQLRKLTNELQDIVMSIRMVPVSGTFHKMERIVRDMSVKIHKKAKLAIIGEDTELDKNVLDNLFDPLMHLVRNAMDHGLEPSDERERLGKDPTGVITLEARNSGSDVLIVISDDGRGLDRDTLIKKGLEKGLLREGSVSKLTDREVYSLIFAPGFSTRDMVTEYSGRGVGMDVVVKNVEKIGGSLVIDSTPGQGMSINIRIPLTLAIIDGMLVSVGNSSYIIPMLSIRDSFKPDRKDIFFDPAGNEMIWLRGTCYPIIRLYRLFDVETEIAETTEGILVLVEGQGKAYCLLADSLIGEQQAVVKPLPAYIMQTFGLAVKGLAGCTILGDGSISLILDINELVY